MARGVFCLEGLWEADLRKPSTVQPMLAFLRQNAAIPHIYRDCATPEEFEYYLAKFSRAAYRDYPILYLAFHGEPGRILISGSKDYSLAQVGELLAGRCRNAIVVLGSCNALDVDKRHLDAFLKATGALAVCGYRNAVEWMHSLAFEMLLFSELQENVFDGRGVRAITRKCLRLARSFRSPDPDKNIDFRIVSRADRP